MAGRNTNDLPGPSLPRLPGDETSLTVIRLFAIISLVTGAIGLVLALLPGLLEHSLWFAPVGLIFGIIAVRATAGHSPVVRAAAVTGLVLSGLVVIVLVVPLSRMLLTLISFAL